MTDPIGTQSQELGAARVGGHLIGGADDRVLDCDVVERPALRSIAYEDAGGIDHGERGIKYEDVIDSVNDEFRENEDLPNTTNPDDWARISGRKGERIINVRTLMTGISRNEQSIENITSGQYL